MTEASVRKWFTARMTRIRGLVQPIETGATSVGVPDLYWRVNADQGWLELKIGRETATGHINVKWRPGQLAWAYRWTKQGENVKALIVVKDGIFFVMSPKHFSTEYMDVNYMMSVCDGFGVIVPAEATRPSDLLEIICE